MAADFSRVRLNPLLDYTGVELKQGGVLLDADANELVALIDRRLRALASDTLGRATVSSTTPDAFKITAVADGLSIGKGRLYVDGLLAESHGQEDEAKKQFDPLLAETVFADAPTYAKQPYLPFPPPLPTKGRHLVYLDVWNREVTHLEQPDLVESAVAVETSSRLQTVWQVRVLADDAGTGTSCGTPDGQVPGWNDVIAPSTGLLTTGTFDVAPADDPCELPPTGGYRGLENQLYRVEIHDPGQPGDKATFKWSRENASVGSRVKVMASGTVLELDTLGRDDVLRISSGDWVEITDDVREFSRAAGEMRQVTVDDATRRITFTDPLPGDMLPGSAPGSFPDSSFPKVQNLRVRRWDQKRGVFRTDPGGTPVQVQDLDAADSKGVIKVPADGTTLLLENGVTVSFASRGDKDAKGFKAGDHWEFAARTADASVELLDRAPPRGIHHHFARLGFWDVITTAASGASGTVTDCRNLWPPQGSTGEDCACTQCVTPESHANGKGPLTIQAAVDKVRDTGGTVCLGAGQFQLTEPVLLNGARAVRIRGQGAATLIVTPGGAFSISGGVALAIEDLTIVSDGRASAISVRTVLGLSLQRLIIAVLGSNDATGAAIALAGAVIGATIRDNAIMAPVAVQSVDPAAESIPGNAAPPQMLISAALRIEDNELLCQQHAVSLTGRVIHMMATRITGNEILGCRLGAITVLGLCGPGASMNISGNSLNATGPGITAGVDGLWIEGNKLVFTPRGDNKGLDGAGITLRTGLDPSGADQCQILSNQISGFAGAAIAILSPRRELIVKFNIIERCGNGIISEDEAKTASVSIENNHISDIGGSEDKREGFVVGIGVLRADAATVAGNTIRRIGQKAVRAPLRAGIAVASVQRLRLSGNDISDVAPAGDYVGLAAGIMLYAPYAQAEFTLNHVDRDSQPSSQASDSQWYALLVNQPLDKRLVSRIGAYAAVRIDETRTLVVGDRRPYIVTAAVETDAAGAVVVRGASASVLGNILAARGKTPAVDVQASGDCLFNDNRCELRANNESAAVRITAGVTIVSANRVRSGKVSIELLGDPKRMTVLGNVTNGDITLISGDNTTQLGTPWRALNVLGLNS